MLWADYMDQKLRAAPERRLIMTFALRQALDILQMPQMELSQWLSDEIEKNPLLEIRPHHLKTSFEGDFPSNITLYEHIMRQIREHFPTEKQRKLAEKIFEMLDEKGFIEGEVEASHMNILKVLQTFDPPGIFARSLKESLLLQLQAKGKIDSLAFQLVETCYNDLLHGRFVQIQKKLGVSHLQGVIAELARLSLRPANTFQQEPVSPICPDLILRKMGGKWELMLNDDEMPELYLQSSYLEMKGENKEEKESLQTFKAQAKHILNALDRRKKMLQEVGLAILAEQTDFLEEKGPLKPLKVKDLAEKLQIHESTLSRALSGKYASTPRGLLSLKELLSSTPEATEARETIQKFIADEDKMSPLTDEELTLLMKEKGLKLARRTVAKYRSQLKIGSATQRKHT